jgi:hypothetical protein
MRFITITLIEKTFYIMLWNILTGYRYPIIIFPTFDTNVPYMLLITNFISPSNLYEANILLDIWDIKTELPVLYI